MAIGYIQTRKKLQACKQCLRTFFVKIADIVNQKNASSYLGVFMGTLQFGNDMKEPVVMHSMKQRAEKGPYIPKVCQNMSNMHKMYLIPIVLSHN